MALFEVQLLIGNDWKTRSVFAEREAALDAARTIVESPEAPSDLRVVEDDDGGDTSRTIWRHNGNQETWRRRQRDQMLWRVEARRNARRREPLRAPAATRAPISEELPSWQMIGVRLVIILTAGWVALEGLRHTLR